MFKRLIPTLVAILFIPISLAKATECPLFPVAIMALAKEVPFSVTSWIRTPKRNELVGGIPGSKHLEGLAVDIVLDNWRDTARLLELVESECLIIGVESGHIHLEQNGP